MFSFLGSERRGALPRKWSRRWWRSTRDCKRWANRRSDFYTQTRDDNSHGIIGVQPLADRSLVFATDRGCLYQIRPRAGGPAEVERLGWFHPQGEAYVASLFTYDGMGYLMGMSRRPSNNQDRYEWLVYDLAARVSIAVPVAIPSLDGRPLQQLLLYGSVTRDNMGNFYLGGVHHRDSRDWPILIQAGRPSISLLTPPPNPRGRRGPK